MPDRGEEFVRGLPHKRVPGACLKRTVGGPACFREVSEPDDGPRLPAMPVAGSVDPAWLEEGHERDQRGIRSAYSCWHDWTTYHDASAINQHRVSGLAKPDRMGQGREKFLCIKDAMHDPDSLFFFQAEDGIRDRKHIGANPVVKQHVL